MNLARTFFLPSMLKFEWCHFTNSVVVYLTGRVVQFGSHVSKQNVYQQNEEDGTPVTNDN